MLEQQLDLMVNKTSRDKFAKQLKTMFMGNAATLGLLDRVLIDLNIINRFGIVLH